MNIFPALFTLLQLVAYGFLFGLGFFCAEISLSVIRRKLDA